MLRNSYHLTAVQFLIFEKYNIYIYIVTLLIVLMNKLILCKQAVLGLNVDLV